MRYIIKAHLERNSNMLCPHFNTRSGRPSSMVLSRSSAASSMKYGLHLTFITARTPTKTQVRMNKINYPLKEVGMYVVGCYVPSW